MSQDEWENLTSLLSIVVGVLAMIGLMLPFARRWRRPAWTLPPIAVASGLGVLSLGINLAVTLHNGVPVPVYHDEFSYLLAADTFAHGRMTNPTPASWEHFETPHQLMVPSYMSKYPPGQGLALAVGQVVFHQPVVGVWLSTAGAAVAIYWMLLVFTPPGWAAVGGIVAAVHPQLVDWSQCYWGGSVAVLGAALLLGGWGRLMRGGGSRPSLLAAVGLAVLANSRPYEGAAVALPLMIALVARRKHRGIAGAVVVLGLTAAAMGCYNLRITGSLFRLPIVEYANQYDIYPKFWMLPARSPAPIYRNHTTEYTHAVFEKGLYDQLRTFTGFLQVSKDRIRQLFETTLKLALLLVPLVAAVVLRPVASTARTIPPVGWLWVAAGTGLVALLAENFVLPHYVAPMLPLVLLLTVIGWQRLAQSSPRGAAAAVAVLVGCLTGAGLSDGQRSLKDDMVAGHRELLPVTHQLQTGRHLVFVSYAPLRSTHVEFVHNGSDLPNERIVWARYFGPAADAPLVAELPGRQVWHLNVLGTLTLEPYAPGKAR